MKNKPSLLLSVLALAMPAFTSIVRGQAPATLTVLHSFSGSSDGSQPSSALLRAKDGNFYGVTGASGPNGSGTIFKITPAGAFSTLHVFSAASNEVNSDGCNAYSGLTQGSDGNFYGATYNGGSAGLGTIYKITPGGTLTTLHDFSGSDGSAPHSALTLASDGSFYGTTVSGGSNGYGTVFKITPAGTLTTLHSFVYYDGLYPYSAPVQGKDGDFYGTTQQGGSNGDDFGAIFQMTADGTLTDLFSFDGDSNGIDPSSSLIQARDGDFYGTAEYGGSGNAGAIFKITPDGTITTLYYFDHNSDGGSDGEYPYVGVFQGSDGNFYGTTTSGGAGGEGTLYKLTPDGTLTTLYSFSALNDGINSDGAAPTASLIQGSDGNFYGTAPNGGPNGDGVVFKLVTATPTITSAYTAKAMQGTAFSYQITATSGPRSFGVQGLPAGLSVDVSTGLLSGTPTTFGTFPLTLNAYNAAGKGSAPLTLTIQSDQPPTITSAKAATGRVGTAFSYQIVATQSPTSYGVQGIPSGLSLNVSTGVISGTPKTEGTYSLTLNAYNNFGKGTATLTLTVQTNIPPTITSATTASGKVGTAFSYQITATGNPTSYGVQGLPAGFTVDTKTGLISGTPKTSGTLKLTLNAFNAAGQGSATLTVAIQGQPVITSATTATATVGKPFSYQITASNQPTSFGVQGLPAGFTVDTSTGLISGTPKGTGAVTLLLNAYNSAGKGSASLNLTINAP